MPPFVFARPVWQSRSVTRKLSQSYSANIAATLQLGDIFGNRIVEAELAALHGFRERRRREQFPYRAEIEDRICRDSFVPRVISETVIKETSLTIYADCDRNAASFPVPRQNRLNILRDNRFNVPLAAHWHGSKQSSDQNCKNFQSVHRAILYCSADVGNAVAAGRQTSLKHRVHERAVTGQRSLNSRWARQHGLRERYPKLSVTFSIALFIISA
jgi:hypothetical protein